MCDAQNQFPAACVFAAVYIVSAIHAPIHVKLESRLTFGLLSADLAQARSPTQCVVRALGPGVYCIEPHAGFVARFGCIVFGTNWGEK